MKPARRHDSNAVSASVSACWRDLSAVSASDSASSRDSIAVSSASRADARASIVSRCSSKARRSASIASASTASSPRRASRAASASAAACLRWLSATSPSPSAFRRASQRGLDLVELVRSGVEPCLGRGKGFLARSQGGLGLGQLMTVRLGRSLGLLDRAAALVEFLPLRVKRSARVVELGALRVEARLGFRESVLALVEL